VPGVRVAMPMVARVVALAAIVAVTLAAAAALAVAPTQAPGGAGPPPAADVDVYVALGDSYTAGPLIPRSLPALGCFRSTHDYPSLLAESLDVETLTDVSCSGADSTHLASTQPVGLGTVPPQLAALAPDTDLVTVGIGGNDFGVFGSLVTVCPRLRAQDPDGDPCRDHFRGVGGDRLLAALALTRDRLDEALTQVHRLAPHAQVVAVGYPRIAPMDRTCPRVLPFADGDYRYANQVERRLNAALRHAARAGGAAFVDTYVASRGHDACAGADAWVNGQFTDPARAQAYHPFRAYMDAVAALVRAELRR
jgi:lysophospholipase L1-like esterase